MFSLRLLSLSCLHSLATCLTIESQFGTTPCVSGRTDSLSNFEIYCAQYHSIGFSGELQYFCLFEFCHRLVDSIAFTGKHRQLSFFEVLFSSVPFLVSSGEESKSYRLKSGLCLAADCWQLPIPTPSHLFRLISTSISNSSICFTQGSAVFKVVVGATFGPPNRILWIPSGSSPSGSSPSGFSHQRQLFSCSNCSSYLR